VDLGNAETLGLQLVNDLVKQIEGSYEMQNDGGTTFKIMAMSQSCLVMLNPNIFHLQFGER